ncbi:type II toxin-antitoxin system RelE/ParE family toxin [Marinilabilia sp.]
MALNLYWSKKADRKFDVIINYLLEEWGKQATKTFVQKVYEFLDLVVEFPEIGTMENAEKQIRGFTIVKQVNVFYTVTEKGIILLDFFDNRQHPKRKRF